MTGSLVSPSWTSHCFPAKGNFDVLANLSARRLILRIARRNRYRSQVSSIRGCALSCELRLSKSYAGSNSLRRHGTKEGHYMTLRHHEGQGSFWEQHSFMKPLGRVTGSSLSLSHCERND